jgi:hypothetical protein
MRHMTFASAAQADLWHPATLALGWSEPVLWFETPRATSLVDGGTIELPFRHPR